MNFLKIILILIIALWIVNPYLDAQEEKSQKKQELVENRILVMEDYLKNRLHEMQKLIKEQEAVILKIEESNSNLQNEVASLKERLKVAEAEILTLKISLASINKTEIPVTPLPVKDLSVKENPVETKQEEKNKYTDPEIKDLGEKLKSPLTSIRLGAILALSKHSGNEADWALITALCDIDIYNRMLACKALGKHKSQTAIYPLLDMMEKENKEMIVVILETIEKITALTEVFPYQGDPQEKKDAIQRLKEKIKKAGF